MTNDPARRSVDGIGKARSGVRVTRRMRLAVAVASCLWPAAFDATAAEPATRPAASRPAAWRGVHFLSPGAGAMPLLERAIAEALAPMGVNVIVFEVNYGYAFESHPELRQAGALTRADARRLAAVCRRHGIRLIPQLNCLGHQSWAKTTLPLLAKYPELDETPRVPADNAGIYCRSWCPLHPRVNEIVFALIDELLEAFEADAFHVGMDEVFLIASDQCPRCRGRDPAALFAKAVNDLHGHIVGKRKRTMLMWGDRLLDGRAMKYGEWEASVNGTAPAVDRIPKDIVVCDWHYEVRADYPSVRYLQEKGFRVWPSSWHDAKAAGALMQCARQDATDRMLGHLCTTWVGAGDVARALLGEQAPAKPADKAAEVAATIRACLAPERR